MNDSTNPKYEWGQRVVAAIDLLNDGSHPMGQAQGLLAGAGSAGEVVQVGMIEESATPVYMVEFAGGVVVGCLEHEIELLEVASPA
jgi:nitrogen fixation protein NifZ